VDEKLIDRKSGRLIAEVSPEFFRPAEVDLLIGDPKKAKDVLGWEAKVSVNELAEMMAKADLEKNGIR